MVALTTTCRNSRSTVGTRSWHNPVASFSPPPETFVSFVSRSYLRLSCCCSVDSTYSRSKRRTTMGKLHFLLAGLYASSALASPFAGILRGRDDGNLRSRGDNGSPPGYGDSGTTTEGSGWGYGTTCKASTLTKTQKASTAYQTQKASTVSKFIQQTRKTCVAQSANNILS